MDLSRIELELLGLADEDYFGLWELISSPGEHDNLESGEHEVRSTVARLVQLGLVGIFRRSGFMGGEEALVADEAITLISNDDVWLEPDPPESVQYVIGATPLGESVYRNRPSG